MVGDVHITENQIDALEKVTLSQLDTMLWHEQRIGRITASKAHQALHTNAENPVKSLLREICFRAFTSCKSLQLCGEIITKKMLLAHTKR